MSDDMDVIEPSRNRSVTYCGTQLEITPLQVGQFPKFTRAMRPILDDLIGDMSSPAGADPEKEAEVSISASRVMDWIEQHGERLIEGVAIAARCDPSLIADGTPDELLELTAAVFAVNLDFFVRRLLPLVGQLGPDLASNVAQMNGSGQTPSSVSSPQGTH